MNLKRGVLGIVAMAALCVVGAGHAGAATSTDARVEPPMRGAISSITASSLEDVTPEANGERRIQFDHFMIDPGNPTYIIPCVRILRRLYRKAQRKHHVAIAFRISYVSNGQPVTRTWTIPVHELKRTTHHPQPANKRFLLIDTMFNIASQPIDSPESARATIRLVDLAPAEENKTYVEMP